MSNVANKPNERQIQRIPLGMKCGKRLLNEAELTVAMTSAVPNAMRMKMRELVSFYVPSQKRGQKLGTMLLNMVCQEADVNGLTLLLTARPSEGDEGIMGDERLIAWYEKFGFQKLQETPTGWLMARKVREKPRVLAERNNIVSLSVHKALLEAQLKGALNA